MRTPQAILIAITLGIIIWSPAISTRDDPASIYNPEGLGQWAQDNQLAGSPVRIAHGPVAGLEADEALLVVGPRIGYTPDEAAAFRAFLVAGGRALVADATGSARQLLADVRADIQAAQIYSTSYAKNPAWPIAEGGDMLPDTILGRPHAVLGDGEVLLASHSFSWIDLDNDLEPDLDEPIGAWPVAVRFSVGAGQLIVVGDDGVFFQDVSKPTAEILLAWLAEDRVVVIDEGHRASADPLGTTPLMAGTRPIMATIAAVGAVAVAWIWGMDLRIRRVKPRRAKAIADDPVLAELPHAS